MEAYVTCNNKWKEVGGRFLTCGLGGLEDLVLSPDPCPLPFALALCS